MLLRLKLNTNQRMKNLVFTYYLLLLILICSCNRPEKDFLWYRWTQRRDSQRQGWQKTWSLSISYGRYRSRGTKLWAWCAFRCSCKLFLWMAPGIREWIQGRQTQWLSSGVLSIGKLMIDATHKTMLWTAPSKNLVRLAPCRKWWHLLTVKNGPFERILHQR